MAAKIRGLASDGKVAVIGLGYVGLPLAVALANHFRVIGFDISKPRIAALRAGHDATGEIAPEKLRVSLLELTDQVADIAGADIFIVTVPTPVDDDNEPDLSPLHRACEVVGPALQPGAIVVFESTVYPGVTEDECAPLLERHSGLTCGVDFYLGYSPERINPGDKHNTVDKITKVVAGQTPEVLEVLAALYGRVTSGGVYRAASIKVAEAAKVIENAQRDINIAFINEVTAIFRKLGISIYDVLDAAGTKWNFLRFTPGLVGGHCIGVDPYYLAHLAEHKLGLHPRLILAGRSTNEAMAGLIADAIAAELPQGAECLVLGLTFKENVPDLRNTKVIDVVRALEAHGCRVDVHDPLADPEEARKYFGLNLRRRLADLALDDGAQPGAREHPQPAPRYDCVIGAVAHQLYADLEPEQLARLLKPGGLIADIKGMWRNRPLPAGMRRWEL